MDEPEAAQGGRDPHASGFTPLEALIARTRTCCLRPFRFFVSWQGVLTLAYTCVLPPRQLRTRGMHDTCKALSLRRCWHSSGIKDGLAYGAAKFTVARPPSAIAAGQWVQCNARSIQHTCCQQSNFALFRSRLTLKTIGGFALPPLHLPSFYRTSMRAQGLSAGADAAEARHRGHCRTRLKS